MTYIPGTNTPKQIKKTQILDEKIKIIDMVKSKPSKAKSIISKNAQVSKGILIWAAVSTIFGIAILGLMAFVNIKFLFLIPLTTLVGIISKIIINNFSNVTKEGDNLIKRYRY